MPEKKKTTREYRERKENSSRAKIGPIFLWEYGVGSSPFTPELSTCMYTFINERPYISSELACQPCFMTEFHAFPSPPKHERTGHVSSNISPGVRGTRGPLEKMCWQKLMKYLSA